MLDIEHLTFTRPFNLEQRAWTEAVGPVPGVYVLQVLDRDANPQPIHRAGGTDVRGVLDIGESKNLARRIHDLRAACLNPAGSKHRAGWEYSMWEFNATFPLTGLHIIALPIRGHRDRGKYLAEAIELALLETYRWKFKDRPPLNASAGKFNKVDRWLRGLRRKPRNLEGGVVPRSAES